MAENEELLDYEEEDTQEQTAGGKADASRKGYVGIHSTSFKDMLLKEQLFDAIQRCGFEHPSEGATGARARGAGSGRRKGGPGAPAGQPTLDQHPSRSASRTPTHASACRALFLARAQSNTRPSRRRSCARTSCARPSPAWARRPCL
jgi:hypothetical protein